MWSASKYFRSVLYVVYAFILLHNLTPHTHDESHQQHRSFGFLTEWFRFFYGTDHQEFHKEDHLCTFRIEEEKEQLKEIEISVSPDFDLLSPACTTLFESKEISFKVFNESKLTSFGIFFQKSAQLELLSDRAPPYVAV